MRSNPNAPIGAVFGGNFGNSFAGIGDGMNSEQTSANAICSLDPAGIARNNTGMNTTHAILETPIPSPPSLVLDADTEAVLEKIASGGQLEPGVYKRIRERAERIRQETLRLHGVLDIGVPAIRELRDGQ